MGRAVQGDHEQALLGRLNGDPGQRPHFRVAQFAARHGGGDLRQRRKRMRHPHLLARRAEIQPAFEVQPVSARMQPAVPPASPPIEFGDQREPAIVRRVQVTGKFGDLRFQFRQRQRRADRG